MHQSTKIDNAISDFTRAVLPKFMQRLGSAILFTVTTQKPRTHGPAIDDLFAVTRKTPEPIRDGVVLLPAFADSGALLRRIERLIRVSPLRRMFTPGGRLMQVEMSNCGAFGWISEPSGYRYRRRDPLTGKPWPAMPGAFRALARRAAESAGFSGFDPDVCLLNRYTPGTGLSPHRDLDEADRCWPIVSVSLGLSATFMLYGNQRGGTPQLIALHDGDVLVFGGPARLAYHGVKKLAAGHHPLTGACRYNLTFRRAR